MIPADLAPGDAKSLARDWRDIELHCVESGEDPFFDIAYGALWAQFGAAHEVEDASVLSRRLCWNGRDLINGQALLYRLFVLMADGQFAAVRDHTVMIDPETEGALVHLSHNLITPIWRRTGLAGWLRALPLQTAREALALHGRSPESPITLVAEMEPLDTDDPQTYARLAAYERAGYLLVDPSRVSYLQPDFRPARVIDAEGGPRPLSMVLLVRLIGRENERRITGGEIRQIVNSLYRMFAATFRASDMAPLAGQIESLPAETESIPLIAPTAQK